MPVASRPSETSPRPAGTRGVEPARPGAPAGLRLARAWRAAVAGVALAVCALPLQPTQAQVRLPAMGEGVSASMPLGEERRLGDQIWLEVLRDPSWLDDPVLDDYLQRLWSPLLASAQRRGEIGEDMRQQFAWTAFMLRDRSINAFALPGGYVGVHLGLIAGTAVPDELVSVLAHELSHVTQRHIARSFESAGRQTALGMAAIVLGMIAASRSGNADVAQAAIAGGQAAMIQGQLNFSRDMEREADRIGHLLMVDAGFSAAGMAAMFDKLETANRLNDTGNFPYLRSHPLTIERIAEAQARAGVGGTARLRANDEHELMRARARVLMEPSVPALRGHLEALQQLPRVRVAPLGTAYAAALSAVLLKDAPAAQTALERLREAAAPASRAAPGVGVSRWVELLQLEAALALQLAAAGDAGAAWGSASEWRRPELLLRGRVVLSRAGAADPALRDLHQALRTWVVRHPADGAAWQMLADCEEARGNRLGMLRATAEANLAAGKVDAAIVTLQAARSQGTRSRDADGVELAIIDSRLAELRRQRMRNAGERGVRTD